MILELATRDMKSREKHLFERISRVITGSSILRYSQRSANLAKAHHST